MSAPMPTERLLDFVGQEQGTSRRSAPRVKRNSTSFCMCLLVEEKGDKETREGGEDESYHGRSKGGFSGHSPFF